MSAKLFNQIIFLIFVAIALWYGGQYAWLKYQEHELELQMRQMSSITDQQMLQAAEQHVRDCLAQGHRGGPYGC